MGLLKEHDIKLVCDVRSVARSRWAHFNLRPLALALGKHTIGYEHLPECGGKTVVPPHELERGLNRIVELAVDTRLALMCSESQPLTKHVRPQANCHRVGLLAVPLKRRGIRILHILPNNSILEIDEEQVPSIWSSVEP